MSWVFILVVIVIVAAVFLAAASKKAGTGSKVGFPYVPAKALFSPAERSFLGVLDQAVGLEHRVFGKVRVCQHLRWRTCGATSAELSFMQQGGLPCVLPP